MWPEKKSGKPASVSPPHWNAARKSRAVSARRRSKAPRRPTRPCMSIPIKPLASPSVSGRSSASWSLAGAPATATGHNMETATGSFKQLATTSKLFARRLLTIGETRLELLTVEVQEERVRLLRAILLALGVAAFGLLAGVALTGTIVVLFWDFSHVAVLLALAGLYGAAAVFLYRRLTVLLRDWKNLPATLDQLRKDRACLEKTLE